MTPAWFSLGDVAAKTHPPTGWRQVLRAFADLKPEAMHVVIKPGTVAEAQDIEGRWQICDPILFPRVFQIAGNLPVAPDRPERTRADFVLCEMLLADDVNEPTSIMNPLTDLERGWEIRTTDRLSPSAVRFTDDEVLQILERLGGKVEHVAAPKIAMTPKPARLSELPPLPDPTSEAWRDDAAAELIERRMGAISWVIESKEFERMSLESGDKGQIKKLCEHSAPKLFKGSTVFDDAWKAGSKRQWWRMADYHKFTKHRGS